MLNFVIKEDPDLQFADSIYKSFTEDRESFDIALSREKYRRDMISRLDDAVTKGEAKGKAEGEIFALRQTAKKMKKFRSLVAHFVRQFIRR